MHYLKLILFFSLAYLPACASKTMNNTIPMQDLEKNFLLQRNTQNQTIKLIKDDNLKLILYKKTDNSKSLNEVAMDFLQTYREDFLIKNPRDEFTISSSKTDDLGFTRIKLNQSYQGIPVWKGIISMHFDRQGNLQIVHGEYFPTVSKLNIKEGMSPEQIFQKVLQINSGITPEAVSTQKIIFYQDDRNPRLAYEFSPTRHAKLSSDTLVLDAITGEVLNQLSTMQTSH